MPAPENKPLTVLPLLICTGLLFLLALPFGELRASDESIFAAIAQDMIDHRNWLTPQFQGIDCSLFPLYPWLVAICSGFARVTTFTVRLPATLSLFGIAATAYLIARRHRSANCGAIAAIIVLTCLGSLRIGLVAQTETLHAFLLTAAWFIWYELGPQRQRWSAAWGVSLLLVFLDTFNVGLKAPCFFYLPLLLTRMPPKTRRRLQQPKHLAWLLFYALLLYLWLMNFCPQQPLLPWNTVVGAASEIPDTALIVHLFRFPAQVFALLLPWGLLAWVPFCLALRPLEPPGSICSFLRAVVFCPFLFYLFFPGQSPLMLLAQLGPLAVLISFNAPIVLHRAERFFRRLTAIWSVLLITALVIASIFWLLAALGKITLVGPAALGIPPRALTIVFSVLSAILLFAAGWLLLELTASFNPLSLAWCTFGTRLLHICLAFPLLFLTVTDRRYAALRIRGEIKLSGDGEFTAPLARESPPPVIYLDSEDAYPAICYYLDCPVRRIRRPLEELPRTDNVIYLLSSRPPTIITRNWEAISPPVNFHLQRETKSDVHFTRMHLEAVLRRESVNNPALPGFHPPVRFTLYRGTLPKLPADIRK